MSHERTSAGLELRNTLVRMNNMLAWRAAIERDGEKLALAAGKAIRRWRTEVVKVSLREAARRLRISAPHLSDIERGRRNPYRVLKRITDRGL